MTLLPISNSSITLPDLKIRDIKIGKNRLLRFAIRALPTTVEIFDADYQGWYELRTNLAKPYNSLYLQKSGRRTKLPDDKLCLKLEENSKIVELNESTKLSWTQHPAMNDSSGPGDIVSSWAHRFHFKAENPDTKVSGLRTPQLGALHSISGYFSVRNNTEPATVVLPTGTGKTETMLAALVYRQLPKVLVMVPTNALRRQIADKFLGLGKLAQLNVIQIDTALPSVVVLKSGIQSVDEAEELLKNASVLIATAKVLDSSNQIALDTLCQGITDLFVDEAHHMGATTWKKVRNRFKNKRVVQFTATPFRNDGNAIGGRIIYNYTMGEAQEAGYFSHINLVPVEEHYSREADRAIADASIRQLRTDLENNYDHLLMARVEKNQRADELLHIYQELAPELNPLVVHSDLSKTSNTSVLAALFERRSRIVICVNMLGEGFDLPNLKVAAIHDIHKSLAITLQFTGRFTRNAKNVGDASVIVNIADPDVEPGLQNLYAQGADWDTVLKRLSEVRIEREIRLQEVVENLKDKGNLHEQISLWNLWPAFSAILFSTTCTLWNPERFKDVIPSKSDYWYALSDEENLLVVLAIFEAPIKWGHYKNLHDVVYKLLIVHYDKERSGLFVFANDYEWFRVNKMAEAICNGECMLVSGPRVFNIFNGLEYPLVRNLGASQIGAISFTQYFGSNVTEGLNRIEAAKSNLSNLAGLGYDDGEKVLWGCSQKKGKVWSVKSGSIADWTDWVKTAWDKVMKGEIDEANITRDFLRPKKLKAKYDKHAVAVQWGEHIQAEIEDKVTLIFGNTEVPLYLIDLQLMSQAVDQPYKINISSDIAESTYEFSISENLPNGFSYQLVNGNPVSIKRGSGTIIPIEEYLLIDPWIIQYVDCSYSYNCYLIELPGNIGEYHAESIETWNWVGIDIKKESMGQCRETDTVQWRSFEQIREHYDIIINDDGKGEAADLVGFKVVDDKINMALIHCKFSGADTPGSRLNDLYELCGQAQKSIRWKHAGIKRLYNHIREREERWRSDDTSRLLKGNMSDFTTIKNRARTTPIHLQVYIVQPGLSKSRVTKEMLKILGSTALYLTKTAQADFIVIGTN